MNLSEESLKNVFYIMGIIPVDYWNAIKNPSVQNIDHLILPLFTNMFLHGSFGHLLGNMWTLFIFGKAVEDRMGRMSYLAFYLLSGLIACGTHIFWEAGSNIPAIGASGAISGVMGAYLFMFPKSQIIMLIPWFIPILPIPSVVYLVIWFLGQFLSGTASLFSGTVEGGVAFWAHIGGFVGGVIIYRIFLKRRKRKHYPDEVHMAYKYY
jgi:membrane associated rhomboid family serine protease